MIPLQNTELFLDCFTQGLVGLGSLLKGEPNPRRRSREGLNKSKLPASDFLPLSLGFSRKDATPGRQACEERGGESREKENSHQCWFRVSLERGRTEERRA